MSLHQSVIVRSSVRWEELIRAYAIIFPLSKNLPSLSIYLQSRLTLRIFTQRSIMLTGYGRLAVAELVFYCPLLFAVIWIGKQSGFDRRTAWIYLLFLALIRIVGGALQLQSEKTPRKALITAAAIASSVGIAPLELFMNWHLKRM